MVPEAFTAAGARARQAPCKGVPGFALVRAAATASGGTLLTLYDSPVRPVDGPYIVGPPLAGGLLPLACGGLVAGLSRRFESPGGPSRRFSRRWWDAHALLKTRGRWGRFLPLRQLPTGRCGRAAQGRGFRRGG